MFQRDYILRMIEMMGDLMRRVKELMDELSQMKLLDEACRRHCGLPMDAVVALGHESLEELLAPTPRLFASELLYARATQFSLPLEDEEALLLKSLRLLVSLWEQGPLCEVRSARLKELKARLLPQLNARDLSLCAEFLCAAEEYADMEDAIFQMVEAAQSDERMRYELRGEAMLRAAARVSEKTLTLARTSSHELREAARELNARYGDGRNAPNGV